MERVVGSLCFLPVESAGWGPMAFNIGPSSPGLYLVGVWLRFFLGHSILFVQSHCAPDMDVVVLRG